MTDLPAGDSSQPPQLSLMDELKAETRRRVAEITRPCPDCGHAMVRSRGQCWSDCGCTSGKHDPAAVAGRDPAGGEQA